MKLSASSMLPITPDHSPSVFNILPHRSDTDP
jgi:hypothetical protein